MRLDGIVSEPMPCPLLMPVAADRLWLYPVAAYCRGPDGRIRVPSPRTTLPCICMTRAHLLCPGYLESLAPHSGKSVARNSAVAPTGGEARWTLGPNGSGWAPPTR